MPSLKLFLFGSPRLERDSTVLNIPRRKALALLIYLAVTGKTQARDTLATLFWPDSSQSQARTALSRHLSELNRTLPEDTLILETETISLGGDLWLDVAEFEAALTACPEATTACLPVLQAAVALYTADFLAGFTLPDCPDFDEWQLFQAESLRQQLATALEKLVQIEQAQRGYEGAIGYARRWLALDPLNEAAHRTLMHLYAQTGQLTAALRQYELCQQTLEQELGLSPQAETTALYEAIRRGSVKAQSGQLPNLANRYHFRQRQEDLLGQGATGQVYRGTDSQTGQPVAIKLLKSEVMISAPEILTRFIREGEALRQLNHPNIVKLLDTAEQDGQHFLVLEYVGGGSLRELLNQQGKLALEQTLTIGLGLSDALTRAHQLQIIHRDLKPGNVLLAEDGTPRLTDFGVAQLLNSPPLTQTGAILGTLDYLSPEACQGEGLDTRTDIWALGILLFEMLSGHHPFRGETMPATWSAIISKPLPDLAALRTDTPPALVKLLQRMLAKDPAQRLASMRQVGAALEAILHGHSDQETPAVPMSPPQAPIQPHNLPAQTMPFIGRQHELADLARLLAEPEVKLVTILAPGGMGKTRLGLAAAERLLNHFRDGVFFVPLAPLSSPDDIVTTIAEQVGFNFHGSESPRQQLLDYFRERQTLLMLDNFEHLLDGASLVTDLLRAAPGVKVLATSREKLNLSGETTYPLAGLHFPTWESPEDVLEYDAVRLFIQSARRVRPDFDLEVDDIGGLARICRLTEGMPLAIVLAAGWLDVLPLARIAAEIQRGLDFLETEQRDVPERHRSVRAAFNYSWERLSEGERQVFMKLAVCRGGFAFEAAEVVAGADLRTLRRLVGKSLVQALPGGRYEVHELLRQYGEEKLRQTNEAGAIRQAHSRYYLAFLAARDEDIKGRRQQAGLQEIRADFENIRQAWLWVVEQRQVDAFSRAALDCLTNFADMNFSALEAHALLSQTISAFQPAAGQPPHPLWDQAVVRQQAVNYILVQPTDHVQLRVILERARARDDTHEMVHCLIALWSHAFAMRDYANPVNDEALALSQVLGDPFYIARAFNNNAFSRLNDLDHRHKCLRRSAQIRREIGDRCNLCFALAQLTACLAEAGAFGEAEQVLEEAARVQHEIGKTPVYVAVLVFKAQLAFWRGELDLAAELLQTGQAFAGGRVYTGFSYHYPALLSWVAGVRGDYEQGYAFAQQLADKPWAKTFFMVWRLGWGLALAHYGLGNAAAARQALHDVLDLTHHTLQAPTIQQFCLPLAAVLAETPERAVELLGLADRAPQELTGWMAHWQPLTDLRHNLEATLGAERYAAVWERGARLDLDTVVEQLLAELADA